MHWKSVVTSYLVVPVNDVLFVGINVVNVLRSWIFSQTFLLSVDNLAAIQTAESYLRLDEGNDYRNERRECCVKVTCMRKRELTFSLVREMKMIAIRCWPIPLSESRKSDGSAFSLLNCSNKALVWPNSSDTTLIMFNMSTDSEQYSRNSCFRGVDGHTHATMPPLMPDKIACEQTNPKIESIR